MLPSRSASCTREFGLVKIPRRASISKNDALAGEESEGGEWQSGDERVHGESDESEGSVPSGAPSPTAPARESPGQEQAPPGPEHLGTADALAARAAAMFDIGRSAPQASGHPPCGSQATKELLLLACQAANDLCDKLGKVLSKAYGNFDRVVALGWLLGDAVGAPLLARDCAYAVGLKARRAAGDIKTELASAKRAAGRAASRLGADEPRRQELAAEAKAAEASLLRAVVELPLPAERAAPAPAASGARKRKLEPEPVALSQDQLLAILDDEVLKEEKECKRALASLESAEKEEDEKERRVFRLLAQVEAHDCGPGWDGLLATLKRQKNAWDACSQNVKLATMHLKECQLDLKDAELAVMDKVVEMGLAREEALLEQLHCALERNK